MYENKDVLIEATCIPIRVNLQETIFWNGKHNCVNGIFAHYRQNTNVLLLLPEYRSEHEGMVKLIEDEFGVTPSVNYCYHFNVTGWDYN